MTENATYTAQYSTTVNTYTVTWIVDGAETTETYEYGATPTFKGSTDKAADAQYTYTFTGWDKEIATVTENVTYTAQYSETLNSYTISWDIDGDGEVDETTTVLYGEVPTHADGVKEGNAQYSYTFTGWSPALMAVTGDATYTAQFEETTNTVAIGWDTDGDGEVDETTNVLYGEVPTHADGEKEDGMFTYTFIGWDKEIVAATEATTYTAKFSKTGWIADETGKQYLVEDAVQKTGWTKIVNTWYYLDTETGYAATGVQRLPYPTVAINGVTYGPNQEDIDSNRGYGDETSSLFIFDQDGMFQYDKTGMCEYDLDGKDGAEKHWAINGQLPWFVGLVQDGNDYYYFKGSNTMCVSAIMYVWRNNTQFAIAPGSACLIKADGTMLLGDGITAYDGSLYYIQNNALVQNAGLIDVGNKQYIYVTTNGQLAVGRCYVSRTNGIIAAGYYNFGEDGLMIAGQQALNGVVEKNGVLYYYENGKLAYKGLMEYGDSYIYVNSKGRVVVGKYWVSKTNGLLRAGYYNFDENGLMDVFNGIVDKDGTLYYYENGDIAYKGLMAYGNSYIYVRSNGQVATGKTWVTKTNGLMEAGYYFFDENGLMTGREVLNGVVEKNGTLYYYENGKLAYKGLIAYGDSYIYVRSNGQVATGRCYISRTNSLLKAGYYVFDENGQMIEG